MSQTLFTNLSSYFNNMDPEDPVYQQELIRPAEIKEDVKLMEQRKRVTNVMRSKRFKKDLENIFLKYNLNEDEENTETSSLFLAEISQQLLLTALPRNKMPSSSQLGSKRGAICINDLNTGGNVIYGASEQQSRCKLASIFRLFDLFGWKSNFNSVMTTRPYADRDQFLINPFGLMFHEVSASSLLTVDYKGSILDYGSTVLEVNPLSWIIHSAVYSCRNSIRAILELKTSEALAISSLEKGLLPICREAIVLGPIGIIDKLSTLIDETKSASLIRADLNNYLTSVMVPNSKILIVRDCGMLICGDTVEEAWHLLMNCQIACETQIKLGNLEIDDLYIPDANIQANLYNQWRSTDLGGIKEIDSHNNSEQDHPVHWRLGELEFEALMRHMDNNGYRTGYFYRQENIFQPEQSAKSNTEKVKYEVEIPPTSISTTEQKNASSELADESKFVNKSFNRAKSEKWFNTPNQYKLVEDNKTIDNSLSYTFSSGHSERKSTKWESAKSPNFSAPIPQHPVTAGAYVSIGHNTKPNNNKDKIQSRINPKELIENQKRVKNKYYQDTNTAGPMSCLLESGLSREEARMLKQESLKKHIGPGSESPNDPVVTSASKGIIQRGHKAIVYKDLFKTTNPFDVTEDELANYHKEVDRKLHPDKYKDVEVEHENTCKEETPEIKITFSQNESTVPLEENYAGDTSLTRRDTDTSNRNGLIEKNVSVPNESFVCDPFFQSDFDEDFNNLKLTDSACASSPKKPDPDDDIVSPSLASLPKHVSGDNTKRNTSEVLAKSASMKSDKKKKSGSFSFKLLGRSKSVRTSAADVLENKAATLAAPGYGTITSETSGVDISNDEIEKDAKSKKKKRKFKLPSFSKKKKDKSK